MGRLLVVGVLLILILFLAGCALKPGYGIWDPTPPTGQTQRSDSEALPTRNDTAELSNQSVNISEKITIQTIPVPEPVVAVKLRPNVNIAPPHCSSSKAEACDKIFSEQLRDVCYNKSVFTEIYVYAEPTRLAINFPDGGCCFRMTNTTNRDWCIDTLLNNEKARNYLAWNFENNYNLCTYINVYANNYFQKCIDIERTIAAAGNANCEYLSTDEFFEMCVLEKRSCDSIQNLTLRDKCYYFIATH
ncbi:MAG: hypothetical protein WC861_05540 [Candidatus Micrarchaeia archaeon]|jgi:hypothetical protein